MTEFAYPAGYANEAIPTLAIMWSNRVPVGFSTDMLFKTENYGPEAFARVDFPAGDTSIERSYRVWTTKSMIELGLIEESGFRQPPGSRSINKVKLYVAKPALTEVTVDYTNIYQEMLAETLPKSMSTQDIEERAIGALGLAYGLLPYTEHAATIGSVSRREHVSKAHVRLRALHSLAAARGKNGEVLQSIEQRVREHPLAAGGRRQHHRESMKRDN